MEVVLMLFLVFTLFSVQLSHPLLLALSLVLISLFIAGLAHLVLSLWFWVIIAMVFLGGMMVIFIYITSLSAADKPSLSPKFFIASALLSLPLIPNISTNAPLLPHSHLSQQMFSNSGFLLGFLTLYLFTALTITVKMSENFKGSLIKSW